MVTVTRVGDKVGANVGSRVSPVGADVACVTTGDNVGGNVGDEVGPSVDSTGAIVGGNVGEDVGSNVVYVVYTSDSTMAGLSGSISSNAIVSMS